MRIFYIFKGILSCSDVQITVLSPLSGLEKKGGHPAYRYILHMYLYFHEEEPQVLKLGLMALSANLFN